MILYYAALKFSINQLDDIAAHECDAQVIAHHKREALVTRIPHASE